MRTALFFILSILLSACAAMQKPSEPTFNQKMLEAQKERVRAGLEPNNESPNLPTADVVQSSLWAKSIGSPYIIRNQKAQKVGDLLTIVVSESTNATTSAKTDAKRDGKVDLSGSLSFGQGAADQVGTVTGATQNKNEFKGEGKTDRSATFTATVQAVVENVLPNGTLFVRGRKTITINNEDQDVEISGFVRPDDIRINNTVVSSVMADAEIRYFGNGVISDKQRVGWGTRLMDAIWPF